MDEESLQSWSGNTSGTSTALFMVGSLTPDLVVRSSFNRKEAVLEPVYGSTSPFQEDSFLDTSNANDFRCLFCAVWTFRRLMSPSCSLEVEYLH